MASLCTHCGHDLSRAPRTGAAASQCPSCGATQLVTSAPVLPPQGPPGRPAPPPRRAAPPSPPAPAVDLPTANPFMTPTPQASAPEASNPFLTPEPVSAPVVSPAPAPEPSRPAVGAPLQVQPGVIVPNVRDPHAEFRRGTWKKPVALVAAAAAIAGGLFFGIPEPSEDKVPAFVAAEAEGPQTVIGASVSPEIIQDPEMPTLANPNPEVGKAKNDQTQNVSPERPDGSRNFADTFKSAAR